MGEGGWGAGGAFGLGANRVRGLLRTPWSSPLWAAPQAVAPVQSYRFFVGLRARLISGDPGRAFEQPNTFGIPNATGLSTFLRAVKQRVSMVQGTERSFKPSDAMIIETARGIVSRQYPSLMSTLYPGHLMTTPQPCTTVMEVWGHLRC